MLITTGLQKHVVSCEVLLETNPKWSDHAGVIIEFADLPPLPLCDASPLSSRRMKAFNDRSQRSILSMFAPKNQPADAVPTSQTPSKQSSESQAQPERPFVGAANAVPITAGLAIGGDTPAATETSTADCSSPLVGNDPVMRGHMLTPPCHMAPHESSSEPPRLQSQPQPAPPTSRVAGGSCTATGTESVVPGPHLRDPDAATDTSVAAADGGVVSATAPLEMEGLGVSATACNTHAAADDSLQKTRTASRTGLLAEGLLAEPIAIGAAGSKATDCLQETCRASDTLLPEVLEAESIARGATGSKNEAAEATARQTPKSAAQQKSSAVSTKAATRRGKGPKSGSIAKRSKFDTKPLPGSGITAFFKPVS